jgi:phage/plasmid primase-like uncharacterized protein
MSTNPERIAQERIDAANAVKIENELAKRGVYLKPKTSKWPSGPCPHCGGSDRFWLGVQKQMWGCRGCHPRGGDVIELVQWLDGCSFPAAVETLIGKQVARRQEKNYPQPAKPSELDLERIEDINRLWRDAEPLTAAAIAYFEAREIPITDVPDQAGLRFHCRCPWGSDNVPCILGRYTTAIGNEPRGLWRRPLTGEKPKTLGPSANCVIRLWPDEDVSYGLVLGEGIETTLAAATRIEHRGALLQPAWAAGSSVNMRAFPVLTEISDLLLLVDHDFEKDGHRAGQEAAEECARRWTDAGRYVTRLIPTELGTDFNDMVVRS